jgi:[ribosomal protein S18]-alanine N-acetyltransferase
MISTGFAIRRATEHDLAEVVVLERETATSPHWAWAEYAGMQQTSHEAGVRRCLFVAADRRNIHGFAVGKAVGHGGDTEVELESVVVRAEARREGIGSALCRAVMDWGRQEGAAAILLEVRSASAGAIRLYGGLGFVAIGRRPHYYRDPADDAVIMRCALGNSRLPEMVEVNGQSELF